MRFGRFLELIQHGDQHLYMTTQNLGTSEDGRPDLWSHPLDELMGEFPLRPHVLGMLIPMSYNLWIGNSTDGSTTGLHHDFHDNLYALLQGRKRFDLYSPKEAAKMRTRGTIALVHPNGRICYEGAITLADGSDAGAVKADQELADAEFALEEAQQAIEDGEAGNLSDCTTARN